MKEKELRLALICYGGISLAVYMHGISKEIWRLAKASRNFHDNVAPPKGSQAVYRQLLETIAERHNLKLRILPDILAGASAGGINAVFLAQAIATGQSLDPLTKLWLETADVDVLLEPDSRPFLSFGKSWARPIVAAVFRRPGSNIFRTASREVRGEIRAKLSRFVRSRWFSPPFSGMTLSKLLADALTAMEETPAGPPLLPARQPIDLMVTATSLWGREAEIQINSPPMVRENEHRLNIIFRRPTTTGQPIADMPSLVFAARSTASFPGAFEPLQVSEIDGLVKERKLGWPERSAFLKRVFPGLSENEKRDAALIDGSVLTNAPFEPAIEALRNRPAHREIDRRFVYIDPTPATKGAALGVERKAGWFRTIFGALSTIPREQPIRDNLERIERRTNRILQMRHVVEAMRDDIEDEVERQFNRRLFISRPSAKKLGQWRHLAQRAASENAGHGLAAYVLIKLTGIVDDLALLFSQGSDKDSITTPLKRSLLQYMSDSGLDKPVSGKQVSETTIEFLKLHDLSFRIRRLRFVARRYNELAVLGSGPDEQQEMVTFHDEIFDCLSKFIDLENTRHFGQMTPHDLSSIMSDPARCLDDLANRRKLEELDVEVDERIARALAPLDKNKAKPLLLAYLGFPYFDIATLPMLQGEGLDEFDPIRVDRISPEDALSIRDGGVDATLRGVEFHGFGGFFSRAFRENDYLWGRLHGAERMIDIVLSSVPRATSVDIQTINTFKRNAFNAILDEEEEILTADRNLISDIRKEVEAKLP